MPTLWEDLIGFISLYQGTKLTKNIMGLSIAVSFYKVWEARNSMLHKNVLIPPTRLAKDVINIIKSRLSTCKSFIKATSFCQYYCNWLL